MYGTLALWLNRLPGGLLHTNIGCCSLFAATSGSSVATAATVGTVAMPNLKRHGYGSRQALGSLAAGGTLGILIPPSVNLLIYGSLANESIGQLFIAGIIPGIALTCHRSTGCSSRSRTSARRGSTRRPAGHTGLYGLKPSIGRIPRAGGLPQILLDFEVVGTFARSIEDLRLLYAALAVPDRRDPVSRSVPATTEPGTLRVLSVPLLGEHPCDPQILAAHRALAARVAGLGHAVEEAELPLDLGRVGAFWGAFGQIGLAHLRETVPDMSRRAQPQYLAMAEAGVDIPAHRLFGALETVRDLRAEASRLFADWDVILMPTAATQPWPAEETHPEVIDGRQVGPRGHAIYTGWVNAAGLPGLAVPAGTDRVGLAIGVQLIGDIGAEEPLLGLARDLADGSDGWQWPELATRSPLLQVE